MQKFHGQVAGLKVQTVDTTGAGDAFCAGLLSQLAQSPDIIEVRAYVASTNWLRLLWFSALRFPFSPQNVTKQDVGDAG